MESPLLWLRISSRSVSKYGYHRQFLFLIGWFLKKSSPLKPLCQMNWNLVGCIYGRSSIRKKKLIFSIVFYFLLTFFTNFQVWEAATAMFDGSRGSSFMVWKRIIYALFLYSLVVTIFKEFKKNQKKSIFCNNQG
jgi:hypothetical protein